MKRIFFLAVLAILLIGFSNPGMAYEKGSWTGWIADSNCAKDHERAADAAHAACAKSCVRRGAGWALSTPDGHILLEIEPDKAEEHLGHQVLIKRRIRQRG